MTINELDLDFEGMNVHCWEGGSGFPVVMIHGSGPGASTMGNWRNVLDPMAERYRIIACDMIGFGLSGRKAQEPYFDLDMWTRQGQFVLDHHAPEGEVGIVAHSLAAVFAIRLALKHTRITKLLITGSTGQRFPLDEVGMAVWTFPESREDLRRAMEFIIYNKEWITDDFLDNRMQVIGDPEYKDYFTKMFGGDKQQYMDATHFSDEDLGKLNCDVTFVHGRDDLATKLRDTALPMSQKMKKADLYAIARCGHGPALEHPDKFMMAANNLFG